MELQALTFELEPLTSEHEGLISERQSLRLAAEALTSEHESLTLELHHFSSEHKTLTTLHNTWWTEPQAPTSELQPGSLVSYCGTVPAIRCIRDDSLIDFDTVNMSTCRTAL